MQIKIMQKKTKKKKAENYLSTILLWKCSVCAMIVTR